MQSINGAWFEITPHAVQRALDMALDAEAIRSALGDPRDVRRGVAGRELWTRGKVTVAVEPREGYWAVITFMWSTAAGWAADRDTVRSRDRGINADRTRAMRFAVKQRKRGRRQP